MMAFITFGFVVGLCLGLFIGFAYGAARYQDEEEELEEGMEIKGEPGEDLKGRHGDDEWLGKCPDPRGKGKVGPSEARPIAPTKETP